jgi:hypothetical protein
MLLCGKVLAITSTWYMKYLQSRVSGNFPSPNPAGLNLLEIPFIESNNLKDSRDNYPAM